MASPASKGLKIVNGKHLGRPDDKIPPWQHEAGQVPSPCGLLRPSGVVLRTV